MSTEPNCEREEGSTVYPTKWILAHAKLVAPKLGAHSWPLLNAEYVALSSRQAHWLLPYHWAALGGTDIKDFVKTAHSMRVRLVLPTSDLDAPPLLQEGIYEVKYNPP